MPSRLIAPAPVSSQAHISKVPAHITVTIESSIAPTTSIPVATISGQQVSAHCPQVKVKNICDNLRKDNLPLFSFRVTPTTCNT